MSFYNMLNKVNPFTGIIMDLMEIDITKIDRFRDCGFNASDVWVYTRTGGKYRDKWKNEHLVNHEHYLSDLNDTYDTTYAIYRFKKPVDFDEEFEEAFRADSEAIGFDHKCFDFNLKSFYSEPIDWKKKLDDPKTYENSPIIKELKKTFDKTIEDIEKYGKNRSVNIVKLFDGDYE